jgi:hypothetical protein
VIVATGHSASHQNIYGCVTRSFDEGGSLYEDASDVKSFS